MDNSIAFFLTSGSFTLLEWIGFGYKYGEKKNSCSRSILCDLLIEISSVKLTFLGSNASHLILFRMARFASKGCKKSGISVSILSSLILFYCLICILYINFDWWETLSGKNKKLYYKKNSALSWGPSHWVWVLHFHECLEITGWERISLQHNSVINLVIRCTFFFFQIITKSLASKESNMRAFYKKDKKVTYFTFLLVIFHSSCHSSDKTFKWSPCRCWIYFVGWRGKGRRRRNQREIKKRWSFTMFYLSGWKEKKGTKLHLYPYPQPSILLKLQFGGGHPPPC